MDRAQVLNIAIYRQHNAIAQANCAVFAAKRRIELFQRILWRVPLHEWAEAKRRGADAVRMLLEAYTPENAALLAREGLTPRCPPWATRKYRTEAA